MSPYTFENISYSPLLKAFSVFQKFLAHSNSDQEKAGTIQAFEFCYELSWKLMKKILAKRGLITNTPRDTFRSAAQASLIDDPEVWFEFIEKRNLTVHTYNEKYSDEVMLILPVFEKELDKFIKQLTVVE